MRTLAEMLCWNLAAHAVVMLLCWLRSLQLGKVCIVDSAWGLAILASSWSTLALTPQVTGRGILLTVAATFWAARLSGHVTWRNWNRPEDRRYAAFRAAHGQAYAGVSLVTVFLLQALLGWVVALPVQLGTWSAVATPGSTVGLPEMAGFFLALFGVAFEGVADWQLAVFKRDPANAGRVMRTGLWARSRHPNYFGEACVWWGMWLMAAPGGMGWAALLSPVLVTVLLLKVSGVTLAEKGMDSRRPGYAAYVRETPAFFPRIW